MRKGREMPQRNQNASARFHTIQDNFSSIEQVQQALRQQGLEGCELIVGIDFTKSNEWQGKRSFGGKCLHDCSTGSNPYLEAFTTIARTLAAFDDDQLIPCYGFGDATTHSNGVFSFHANDTPCQGFEDAVRRYLELAPNVKMSGPTSFAPIIQQAMRIVKNSHNSYHILLILADGGITRSADTRPGQLSVFERETADAIIAASELPLSIVVVGVGDGPWDTMKSFDDQLPQRHFDNFQFVEFERVMKNADPGKRDAQFALRALMEIPEQYAIVLKNQMLHNPQAGSNIRLENIPVPKDPPRTRAPAAFRFPSSFAQPAAAPSAPSASQAKAPVDSSDDLFVCPITQDVMKDPVIAGDGYTYDRAAIENWFRRHNTSPMTNAKLPSKALIPNNVLRSRILETYPDLGKK